jgi:membrane-associated PAP2 superfamily phosphatase
MPTSSRFAIFPRALQFEWSIFLVVVVVLTVPFWFTDLDIQAARFFFHPENGENVWPEENNGMWVFFYRAAPLLVNVLLLGALAIMALTGQHASATRLRRMALFVFLGIILGPGVVVNGIFKDHYGRPRPRQIEQLHGHLHYQPPGMPGLEGKSFPCGHCSVGFVLALFYFIQRRPRPWLARVLLIAALALGGAIGVGRMAAGGHFLSDILWSGFLSYGVCLVLYHPLLGKWEQTPDEEVPELALFARWQGLAKSTRITWFVSFAVLISLLASLATPRKTNKKLSFPSATLMHHDFEIHAHVGDVLITQHAPEDKLIYAHLAFKGFGFPTSKIDGLYQSEQQLFSVLQNGMFTDVEGKVEISLPADFKEKLVITADKGAIYTTMPAPNNWTLSSKKGSFLDLATPSKQE